MRGWEGLYGRPRPVHLASMLAEYFPTPRATIKALPTSHHPPSPLRIIWLIDAYWAALAAALG